MLCKQYISNDLFTVKYNEILGDVLSAENEYSIEKYIVVEDDENKFLGMISVEDVADKNNALAFIDFEEFFIKSSVKEQQHILSALQLMESLKTDVVPVVSADGEFVGEINQESLIDALAKYLSVNENSGGMVVLEVNPVHYSIAEIVQIVQSGNADVVQLNTQRDKETGNIIVSIVLNKSDVSFIVSTFQRYEYNVTHYFGEESYDNELKSNYDLLMKYMNI